MPLYTQSFGGGACDAGTVVSTDVVEDGVLVDMVDVLVDMVGVVVDMAGVVVFNVTE